METTQISKQETFMGKEDLLNHWLGHRNLTRRVIEKFPEKELFEFSVEGMRPFSDMVKELLSIASPGLHGIVSRSEEAYNHDLNLNTKAELLAKWDEETPVIIDLYNRIPEKDFPKNHNLFGQYNFPIKDNILYFIDNEIHHRAQGYVYLRALGIEPPFFWER
ncbi:damage-inducible protein DinB [Elizabethkingia miricola]|uniref:DinB family protein n=1 Tax=Elizabethkingia bruuniana TaxID=1756149 RepID=UPI000999191C|nr:DinB family protein [Elizabethkingia bruuniana]OPC53205.1 damage-inducible protein DinB [Elizabethkingia bruuniana]OPC67153.1 damage-inducible protein DinB [Elizabethkingia bruuniana]RBI93738.1 damage-inducible protein DinB [Elizabethkingia miricola]